MQHSFLPSGLIVQLVITAPDQVTILARPRRTDAQCPLCSRPSRRVHSRYRRRLRDLPWQGRQVHLCLQVRRFRCAEPACRCRVFAERLPLVGMPRRQRTERLAEIQRAIGHAAGGEAGSRLADRLAVPVSGDTLLRLIRAAPALSAPKARVLGIDDWAWLSAGIQ